MYAISATQVRRQCNQPNSQAVDAVENYSNIKYVNPRQKIFVRCRFQISKHLHNCDGSNQVKLDF